MLRCLSYFQLSSHASHDVKSTGQAESLMITYCLVGQRFAPDNYRPISIYIAGNKQTNGENYL